ncbi:MAG: hypothetical protein COT43_06805 [Candidatus Marinimicrobia bacterium CG08_land_8_20_14_0_20_45_22]|nr:MAG: hypothetical protein COT43_06805 [Candidatus Marinimicrobia bacterium CG08_land_8_20_14_0_20_45_22]
MKTHRIFTVAFILLFLVASRDLFAQAMSKSALQKKFFETDMTIDQLRKELAEIRKQIHELEITASVPSIRKEINKMIQLPEMKHEILLNNGTIVKGKIVYEDFDKIVVQTQIGELTLSKKEIKVTREAERPQAKCVVVGPITEKIYDNMRVYTGQLKNEGIRRADFPKIIFYLYDEKTNLVATDSMIVPGTYHMFLSGVQTDATIEPGQTFPFECSVSFHEKAPISYYIKKISWEEFDR